MAPFQRITDDGTKPVPVAVKVIALLPRTTLLGEMDVSTGNGSGGGLMTNALDALVPPPGAGVTMVTCAVAAATRSAAGMIAVSVVADTKVVVRALPFHRISEPATKPVPVAVRVMPASPAVATAGAIDVSAGAGFDGNSISANELNPLVCPVAERVVVFTLPEASGTHCVPS